MSIYAKLMAARVALHGRQIKKSGKNTFANYSYMELGDFLIPTQEIFAGLGLCGVVSFTADTASLTITDVSDGAQIVITSPMGSAALKGCHEVQNIGAVETYQRRYLWVTAMEIVEHDALDSSGPVEVKSSTEVLLEASVEQNKQKRQGVMGAVLEDIHLDANTKIALGKLAERVKPLPIAEAYQIIEDNGLDSDEKVWLWSLLDSKMRSALKRERETRQLTKEPA